jgi:ubiquinone biosynthesis monooxygenase Coq6
MMSAMDKLQKLYSPVPSSIPLLVEARSMGVEVLNELDTIKSALMMTAGSQAPKPEEATRQRGGGDLFQLAASGVQALSTVASVGEMLANGARQALTNSLGRLGEDLRKQSKKLQK